MYPKSCKPANQFRKKFQIGENFHCKKGNLFLAKILNLLDNQQMPLENQICYNPPAFGGYAPRLQLGFIYPLLYMKLLVDSS